MPRTTPTEPNGEGVVIYTHGQRPAELAWQNAALQRYCHQTGLEVITEFHDLEDRTIGLDLALRAIEEPCIRYLLTTSWPPAALSAEDALSVSEILDHYHTRLVTIDGQLPDGATTSHHIAGSPPEERTDAPSDQSTDHAPTTHTRNGRRQS